MDHGGLFSALRTRSLGIAVMATLLGGGVTWAAPQWKVSKQQVSGRSARYEQPLNHPPVISVDLPQDSNLHIRQDLTFSVTVKDPDGDRVTVSLLNPPPGLVFHPSVDAPSPSIKQVRWLVQPGTNGLRSLVFSAHDNVEPAKRSTFVLRVRVGGTYEFTPPNPSHSGILTGDVTGDGIPDVVGGAQLADVAGVVDAGALYVWRGGESPTGTPFATLTAPGSDGLGVGYVLGQGIQLADVSGDGVLDLIAADRQSGGTVHVWKGGASLQGSVAATATLTDSSSIGLGGCGFGAQGVQVAEVTGDGVLDLVVGDASTGAIHIWAGGGSLVGPVAAKATLDGGGCSGMGQSIQIADLDGDGVFDIVASDMTADIGGVAGVGAIYVWSGGLTLTGVVGPSATLHVPGAPANSVLGRLDGQGFLLGDVTGDGALDVVSGSVAASVGGVPSTGELYVWVNGPSMNGLMPQSARLYVPGAAAFDRMGKASLVNTFWQAHRGVQLADLSGDGVLDIVGTAIFADFDGIVDAGAVYMWAGSPALQGSVAPTATATVLSATDNDWLGYLDIEGEGVQFADVTGDGTLDLVVGCARRDLGGTQDVGACYVWAGGPGFLGNGGPTASLSVPGVGSSHVLGEVRFSGQGLMLADVSADGVSDIVIGAAYADTPYAQRAGAIYVWEGGGALSGPMAPTSSLLVPTASYSDGLCTVTGQGIQLADVTGDGALDIVSGAPFANGGDGEVYVWAGGNLPQGEVAPMATLSVPGAASGIGWTGTWNSGLGSPSGQAVQLVDVSNDGQLDVVVGASSADVGGTKDTGAVYAWIGGPSLSGAVAPVAALEVPGASIEDSLGGADPQGLHFADVTGDGILDLIGVANQADVGGVQDTGAIYLWKGPLIVPSPPTSSLSVPGAAPLDQLGT
jgi:hypothetical protein